MRIMAIMGKFRIRFSSVWSARLMAAAILLLPVTAFAAPAAEKIAVFPTAPFYIYIVYESLAVFWVAILSLLVIIRMKIREIERVQEMGADKEDPDAPMLE
ncbi:MAG: hypothetical protein Q8M86_06405 [Syntrophales bacterium]|nr:hypothetical protein [Syntrophales bacterium]MDP3097560.1 hypothetical protein [Syntrophales bacterium]